MTPSNKPDRLGTPSIKERIPPELGTEDEEGVGGGGGREGSCLSSLAIAFSFDGEVNSGGGGTGLRWENVVVCGEALKGGGQA